MDILETVDELEGELIDEDFDTADSPDGNYSIEYVMSREEAEEITHAIKSAATATFILLSRAHSERAHKALGYETWADYVGTEFEMSAQRSYQLLDMNRVVKEIECATPEGTHVKLTEAQARDIKRELPKITERIREETQDLTPEEASAKAREIIEDEREQKKAEDAARKAKEKELDEAREEARRDALEEAADQLLEANPEPGNVPESVSQPDGMSLVAAAHFSNLRHALEVFDTLPSPEDFYESVSEVSYRSLEKNVSYAIKWLCKFSGAGSD